MIGQDIWHTPLLQHGHLLSPMRGHTEAEKCCIWSFSCFVLASGPDTFCGRWVWLESLFLRTPASIHNSLPCEGQSCPEGLGFLLLNLSHYELARDWAFVVHGGFEANLISETSPNFRGGSPEDTLHVS